MYHLSFAPLVQDAITEITVKYGVALSTELSLLEVIKKQDPELVIFRAAKKILNREGTFKGIIESLQKDLDISQKKAEELTHDIKNSIVVLAEPITNSKNQEEPESVLEKKVTSPSAEEDLLKRITQKPEEPPQQKNQDTYREPIT